MNNTFNSDRKWNAHFITCEWKNSLPVILKKINICKKIKTANAYVCGQGLFEMNINGKKVSDNLFEPGETNFDKKAFYSCYDVTDFLTVGDNEITVYLGKGFYYNSFSDGRFNRSPKIWGELMLIAQINIEFDNGEKCVFGTDGTWQYSESPITECSWLGGEDCNANIKISAKGNCSVVKSVPFKKLIKRDYPPIKIHETVKAVEVKKLQNGDFTVKFERNFAGIYTFKANLKQGARLTFTMGEFQNDDGTVDQRSCVFGAKSFDSYTADNSGIQSYTPKFVYHAGQYMQISGADFDITPDMITGYAVRCMNEKTGSFESSGDAVNKIHSLILNSVCDNMQSIITDCPHREKLGWLEQSHLLYDVFASNFNVEKYFEKISDDITDSKNKNGSVPSIVPPLTVGQKTHALRDGTDDTPNDPTWCGAVVLVPYYTYLEYGNASVLKKAFPSMVKYIDYLVSIAEKGDIPYLIESKNLNRDLGDWVSIEYTDVSFVVSCIFYQLINTMSKICNILKKTDIYGEFADKIKNEINKKYYLKDEKQYADKTQTANALPLYLGIAPNEDKNEIIKNLVDNVIAHDYHLTCGEVGIKPLFYVLSDNGYCDIVYKMITNDEMPSYKHFINIGRTTLPESWQAETTWSQNHCMLGIADAWLYRYVGGIRNGGTAYERVIVSPYCPPDIDYVKTEKNTPYGTVRAIWKRTGSSIDLNVSAPEKITVITSTPIDGKISELR